MNCDICERGNAEYVGISCGKYRVCMPCIRRLIETEMIILGRDKK